MATSVNFGFRRPTAFEVTGDSQKVSREWKAWIEEFEAYADSMGLFINDADDTNQQQRRALLLYTAGKEVRNVFKQLPDTGEAKDYQKAVDALNRHFIKRTNATFLRHKFRLIVQMKEENVSQFVIRLREAAEGCDFDDADKQIKDQVIAHCRSDKLRCRLLEKGDTLNLQQALNEASLLEAVTEQARQLKLEGGSQEAQVSRVHQSSRHQTGQQQEKKYPQKGECYRCGSREHYGNSMNCPARGKNCKACGRADHFEKKCRTKKKEGGNEKHGKKKFRKYKARHLQAEPDVGSGSDTSEDYVFMTRGAREKSVFPWIPVNLGGVKMNIVVESGSDVNIIDEAT